MRNLLSPRSVRFWAGAILLATAPIALSGCGGSDSGASNGSGSGSPAPLTGKTAIQAPIIAGYQAFIGGAAFAFHQVQSTLPDSSPFKGALKAAFKLRTASTFKPAGINGPDTLGLYEVETTTSTSDTVAYYTDAAATKSAGTLSIGYPSGTTLGTYKAYPVDFTINANVTAGPLPFTGSGTIALLDSSGKGELKGNFSLLTSKVSGNADLLLSDTGNVTGTATVIENGQTLSLANVTGPIAGSITGNVAVAPQGYTGTATLSIVGGTFTVVLNTPSGTATGSNTSLSNLNISLAGTTTSFSNALTASPTSTGTTGSGGGGGTGGAGTGGLTYDTPVYTGGAEPFVNNSGHLITGESLTQITYQTTIQGNSQTILTPHGDLDVPIAFNNKDSFILAPYFGASNTNIYVYAGPNATPAVLPGGTSTLPISASALNDSGRIVGFEDNSYATSGSTLTPITWASATSNPTVLLPPSTTVTKSGLTFTISGTNITVSGITGADTLKLTAVNGSATEDNMVPAMVTGGKAVYDSTVSGYFLTFPATYTVTVTPYLKGVAGTPVTVTLSTTAVYAKATAINNSNAIIGVGGTDQDGYGEPLYWSSPTAAPKILASVSNPNFSTAGINASGQIFASDTQDGLSYYWSSPTATAIKLPALSGYPRAVATAINTGGTICGYCSDLTGQTSHAVIWRNGVVTDLNTLFPASSGTVLGAAYSINDSNLIACNGSVILIH